ncbi:MAG: glycine--tRNA ligase [Phycisphaerales bacterium]
MSDAKTANAPTHSASSKSMDEIVALCKRRGFVYPASEIYGGINGFWDYGPLGVALKNNLRDRWWRDMVECPPDGPDGHPLSIVGVDTAIIQNPKVWEASGHVGGFNDPMVDCRETKARYRADQLFVYRHREREELPMFAFVEGNPEPTQKKVEKVKNASLDDFEVISLLDIAVAQFERVIGPDAKNPGTLTEPRQFNLMFKTYVGAVQDEDSVAYLRPETAQGIFTNYKNVLDTMRVKVPFGIAQIGKSFRNEVTPRNFIFRSREFEQMEMEWFCHPDDAREWYEFWVDQRTKWWASLGVDASNLQRREHDEDELAHYSTACADVEYRYPFTAPGYGELEGIAHRGCFDLAQHQEHSGTKLEYFDQERQQAGEPKEKTRYLPHVIEPAAGLTRGALVLLCEAYTPDDSRPSRMYMKFHPSLAPIKAAVFPLVNKDGMPEKAEALYKQLRRKYATQFDVKQNIGKRYARMDEAGAPYCFTIDSDTLSDGTVTVRHRDSTEQERINIDRVEEFLAERVEG